MPQADVIAAIDNQIDPYPAEGSSQEKAEVQQLIDLHAIREQPYQPGSAGLPNNNLSWFLRDPRFRFNAPPGATLGPRNPGSPCAEPGLEQAAPFIATGSELATLFEAETPGVWHAHVFNVLLDSPVIRPDGTAADQLLREVLSPPRQALIWEALYASVSSALTAAWYYKWLAPPLKGGPRSRRRRPVEAAADLRMRLPITYDFQIILDRGILRRNGSLKPPLEICPPASPGTPIASPGTPRHPAYPSGHSTYSAAASTVMGCLLPRWKKEWDLLAENIGEARLWGGVHYLTDHEAGRQLGQAVGNLVLNQLRTSIVAPCPKRVCPVPSVEELEAQYAGTKCGELQPKWCDECDYIGEGDRNQAL